MKHVGDPGDVDAEHDEREADDENQVDSQGTSAPRADHGLG